jgi:hypothetical protein
MIKKKIFAVFLMFWILSTSAFAQATEDEKKYTAFEMRSNGKIYVVVAVMLIIMLGLLFYVVRIDRKITKLEEKHAGESHD